MGRGRFLQLTAALLLLCPLSVHAADARPLLRYRERQSVAASSTPIIARYRVVVDRRALTGTKFTLDLPGRKKFRSRRGQIKSEKTALKTVTARLLSTDNHAAHLSLSYKGRKALYGVIEAPGQARVYVLKQEGSRQFLEVLQPSGFPDCGVKHAFENSSAPVLPDGAPAPDPATARVMVVYTTAARQAAGGTDQMLAEINTAVALANTGYSNSGIPHRIELIHTAEVSPNETGDIGQDLDNLTDLDGKWDEVLTLRQLYGADFVSLLIQTSSYCGMAWLTDGWASMLFSVVVRTCISNHSFAHELGHNTGAGHDVGAGGPGVYPDSSGWRFTGNDGYVYRTVMAYAPGTRINYFSNPSVNYQGQPTGVIGSANNASTLNLIMPTIAAALNDVATPTPTNSPTPTPTGPTPTPTVTPTGPTATPTPTVTPTPTITPTPNDAEAPILTPAPTATPTTVAQQFQVSLRRLQGGKKLQITAADPITSQPAALYRVKILRKRLVKGARYAQVAQKTLDSAGAASYKVPGTGYYRAKLASGVTSNTVKVK